MVFLHFPSNLTEEELMLQAKYLKLRKKKKALEEMKVPKPEPEKANPLKRPLDPKDAKELAKKLIQSGKVSISTKQAVEKTTFKRPRTLERKILSTGRSEGHGGLTPGYSANYPMNDSVQFEPFTPHPESTDKNDSFESPPPSSSARFGFEGRSGRGGFPNRAENIPSNKGTGSKTSKRKSPEVDGEPFKSSESGGGRSSPSGPINKGRSKPKRGPTIYIQAHNITEDILKENFGKFGKIVNIKLNNQTVGFITYDKVDSAELAIQEMNGMTTNEISFDVQFAIRQPNITQLINDASASASWTALASSPSQKSIYQDKRQQVVYDDNMDSN